MQRKVHSLISGSLFCEDAFQTTQFYRGKLFVYIDNLITQRPSEDKIPIILQFCSDVIKLVVKWLKASSSLFPFYYQGNTHNELYLEDNNVGLACVWYELLETLRKIFGVDPRVNEFFHTVDANPENSFIGSVLNMPSRSKTVLLFTSLFFSEGGFETILNIIRNEDEKSRVPFGFLNQLVVYDISDVLDPNFALIFYNQYNEAILRRIEIVSETELKDLKYEEIITLINRMRKFRSHDHPFGFEILKLNFFLKMLKSVYLEKRIKALTEISIMIESMESKINSYDQIKIKSNQEELKN